MKIKIKKRKKRGTPAATIILLTAFILMLIFGGSKRLDYYKHYSLTKGGSGNAVINTRPLGDTTAEADGIYYIKLEAVKAEIDRDIYYNKDEGRVIITTPSSVVRLDADGSSDTEGLALNFAVYNTDDGVYLPTELIGRVYGYKITRSEKNGILSLDKGYKTGTVGKDTRLYADTDKGEYFAKLKKGTPLYIYDDGTDGMRLVKALSDEDFGLVGYIPEKCISDIGEERTENTEKAVKAADSRINLVFDQISNAAGAAVTMSNGLPEGVNVLCPTWFSFKDAGGEIVNKANADYVEWAHKNGAAVWGLVTDNFDAAVSHAVLTDDKTREYAIKQLIAYADTYDLDGINIDFEALPKTDGEYWIQFLRELAPVCHSHGLTLSCDLFVPRPWSLYYDRKEVGETADHVIVMGYDEHYGGSDTAGSVASLGWSLAAAEDTLAAGVPKEKLILGIPFYTRIWTEKDGELTSAAYSMSAAEELLNENNASFSYDEKTGQNYAEFTDGEGRHRCWLEDEQSIKKRVQLAVKYELEGIAAWKLRMEKDGIAHTICSELR